MGAKILLNAGGSQGKTMDTRAHDGHPRVIHMASQLFYDGELKSAPELKDSWATPLSQRVKEMFRLERLQQAVN